MEEDIQNHLPTVMFRGTPCSRIIEIIFNVVLHLSQNTKYYLFIDLSNHALHKDQVLYGKKHYYTRAKIGYA